MLQLTRGQRVKLTDLTTETRLKLSSTVEGPEANDVVVLALLLDDKGVGISATSVVTEEHQTSPCGSVVIKPRQGATQAFEVDLLRVPEEAASIMFAFGITSASKKRSGPIATVSGGKWSVEAKGAELARFTFTQADVGADTALMLGELYKKSGAWRLRAVGDGFTGGVPTLLSRFKILAGAVSSTSPGGSLVMGTAPAGLWLPKVWPGERSPAVPKDLAKSVGITLTRDAEGQTYTGTGFMVSPGGFFVTCWHVVHDAVELSVAFGGSNQLRKAQVVAMDQDSDLALCWIEDKNGASDWLLPVGPDLEPGLGDELGLLGYPLGVSLGTSVTYTQGVVSSLRKRQGVNVLQIDAGSTTGSSGGPVFRRSDGLVVGVLSSGVRLEGGGMLINFAIDIRALWSLGWVQRLQ